MNAAFALDNPFCVISQLIQNQNPEASDQNQIKANLLLQIN